jgi:hypothetical protein
MLIVAIGLTVSFLITKTVYDEELLREKQSEMMEAGGHVLSRLEKQRFPEKETYLDGLSALGTYKFTLIREGQTELAADSTVERDGWTFPTRWSSECLFKRMGFDMGYLSS